jgi:hypothetical protein
MAAKILMTEMVRRHGYYDPALISGTVAKKAVAKEVEAKKAIAKKAAPAGKAAPANTLASGTGSTTQAQLSVARWGSERWPTR